MKRFSLFIFFNCASCIIHCAFSQNPLVKMWDKKCGGLSADLLYCFMQTSDQGYLLGGLTGSGIGGDKTEAAWGTSIDDFWVVKMDSLGNKQWDRDLGGLDWDELQCLDQCSDGGFIVGGWSESNTGGNKTQSGQGSYDYWIVKLDANGNQQWDKDYGGTSMDVLQSIKKTRDGGYILGGWSYSGVGGDKSQPVWAGVDYWIIKTDSLGNKVWDKDFGGTGNDYLFSIQQTTDGGFIMGGYSDSNISGDKTQNIQGGLGGYDYWILKTDSLGNKLWDRDFGGSYHDQLKTVQQTTDGGYILGGISYSDADGDKTEPNWSPGFGDFWMVKTDANGIKQWDKDFGGTGYEDELGDISQTNDRGYLLSGVSYSGIGGNKTESNMGIEQGWIVKTDSLGNKQWDKTIFTPDHEERGMAIQTKDFCYAFANFSAAFGGYKTQIPWNGGADYWIVKFCDSTLVPDAAFTSPHLLCPGTCTDFVNVSYNASSFQWFFPGATITTSTDANPSGICYNTPGQYDVQLIASSANGSDTLLLTNYITVYPPPPPQSITQSGDTLFAIAGSASYQWYFNTNIISGATDYFYVAPQSGDYNIVATDANGCEVEAAIFNVVADVLSTVDNGLLTIFPNPVENQFTIYNAQFTISTAVEISVYNVLGEKVLAFPSLAFGEGQGGEADVSKLPPGLYYLQITSSEKSFRTRFVKQ
jgi:PKD repeat protein